MTVDVIEITAQEMDELVARIEEALNNGLSLEADDIRLVLQILRQFAFMQERLEGNETMKQRYLKLMGLVSSSETQDQLFNTGSPSKKKKPRQKRSKPKADKVPVKVCHHQLEGVEKGQLCPECEKGKLYKFEPASFIRITGQPPLTTEKHIMEQMRCALCGVVLTAQLPDEVLNDGARQQKYGYSARAMMTINRFFMGSPYYRQESLQSILGVPVSASTVYDQCALVSEALTPVFDYLMTMAANAYLYHIDDTGNRILDQTPIEKPNRNGKGTRQRSGIYTSALIAIIPEGQKIVLFQTNIGHAGEWIDEVLKSRDKTLPKPVVACDALSSNVPKTLSCNISNCNSHSRRGFTDIVKNFPQEVEHVLSRYGEIWHNDTVATDKELSLEQRQQYHKQHSLVIMEELKDWCENQQSQPEHEGNSGLGKAISYFLKHYQKLIAFCYIPGAPIDNNLVEMILKLIARGRRNSLFFKSLAGARVADVATSLIATCELNGINLFDYLVSIQQNRWEVSRNPERWLPWTFEQTLSSVGTVAA